MSFTTIQTVTTSGLLATTAGSSVCSP